MKQDLKINMGFQHLKNNCKTIGDFIKLKGFDDKFDKSQDIALILKIKRESSTPSAEDIVEEIKQGV